MRADGRLFYKILTLQGVFAITFTINNKNTSEITLIMSSVSVASSKVEKSKSNLTEELESIRDLNKSLEACLQHFRCYKQGLLAMNKNMEELCGKNQEWITELPTYLQFKLNV